MATGLGDLDFSDPKPAASEIPPDLTIENGQPFRLKLLLRIGSVLNIEDKRILHECINKVDIGVDTILTPSGLWPLKDPRRDDWDPEHAFETRESNCNSMKGSLGLEALKELKKDEDQGWIVDILDHEKPLK